jgi:hypothetical protein
MAAKFQRSTSPVIDANAIARYKMMSDPIDQDANRAGLNEASHHPSVVMAAQVD